MDNRMRFPNPMPEPTRLDPYAQLDWIFEDKRALYDNEATQKNYTIGLVFYKRFLRETNNYHPALEADPRFYLKKEWDLLALHKVKQWIEATNIAGRDDYLTSSTISLTISAIRQTMEHAYEHGIIDRPVINIALPSAEAQPGDYLFKGPVCYCKNPYQPPAEVRRSKTYQDGDACTYWNMCLRCENVLITEMNLPKLFAYRDEIQRALRHGLSEIPRQGELYLKMLMLIDEILTPDVLFSKAQLDWLFRGRPR